MIGVIGQGFVGNAVYQKFKNHYDVLTYDKYKSDHNSTLRDLVLNSKYIFVCLPTPMNTDGSCNTDIIEEVLEQVNEITDSPKTIVLKSTVICGTTERLNLKYEFLNIVFNPEFLTERNAVKDYDNQDRIILGGDRPYTTDLKQIFSKVFPNSRIIKTSSTHAEMVKYLTNTFLAVKVSFANEMYELCNKLEIDYDKVVEYATIDQRLGQSHWSVPGHDGDLGFGGHCFPKDLSAIIRLTYELGTNNFVLSSAETTNDEVRTVRDWEQMKGRAVT
ncbi:nucleotide sugar dehydrogenase [bacterium]|nr:nucleotide sugar dehydrogenase [bacterium]